MRCVGRNGANQETVNVTFSVDLGSVRPLKSGCDVHYHIYARGADADVEKRLMRLMRASEDRAVVRSVTESRELAMRGVH
jgi:hypothetical protein